MDRKAFKQRMQNLKSYRDNNPGKGYWDWKLQSFADGGEVPPTKQESIERIPYQGKLYKDAVGRQYTEQQYYDYLQNSTDEIDRFTGLPKVKGLKPVIDLEDAANFTPIGDAIAVKDTYDAIKNRDWFGAGLAALSVLPFIPSARKLKNAMPIPTVSRPFSKRIDELEAGYERVRNEYSQQLNDALESLIDNEDAFRKAANADKTSGTNYVKTYTDNLRNKANSPDKLPKPYILKAEPNKRAFVNGYDPETIKINNDYVYNNQKLESGLITHELGHSIDIKSGFDYVNKLADPKKFVDDDVLKRMYPTKANTVRNYLL